MNLHHVLTSTRRFRADETFFSFPNGFSNLSNSRFRSLIAWIQPIKLRKREFDRLEKPLGNEKKVHQPGIFSYSFQIETCFKVSCFHDVNSCKLTCFSKNQVLFMLRWRSSRSIGLQRQSTNHMAHREVVTSIQKQTKNRNETGSNLSLGTRLTVLSKRLGRKRCCDTTPDRCLECNRLTILTAHC